MPCLEESPAEIKPVVIKATDEVSTNLVPEGTVPEAQVRELTQTDRLNNRLLKSFLDHMNSGSGVIENFMSNTINVSPNIDEDDRSADFDD